MSAVPSISDIHKVFNTRELKKIRIQLKEEARNLKKLVSDGLEEEELVEDEEMVDLDLPEEA